MNSYEIKRSFYFDAAHFLPYVPKGHKCGRLHGHSFKVILSLKGPINDKEGWIMDFGEIKKIASPVIEMLDHVLLNDIEGLSNPTSENICKWLYDKLYTKLSIFSIEVRESEFATSIYYAK